MKGTKFNEIVMRTERRGDEGVEPMRPGPGVVGKGKDLVSRGWRAAATVTTEFGSATFEVTDEVGAATAMTAALRGAIDQAEVGADNDMVAATITLTRPGKGGAR